MKNSIIGMLILSALLAFGSCSKEDANSQEEEQVMEMEQQEMDEQEEIIEEEVITEEEEIDEQENCDLHSFSGSWQFIVNEDPSTEYIGQIDKYNDSTLNVKYQPETEYDYYFQVEVNCEDGIIFEYKPAGNHGTTTIEGSISLTNFVYQDSTRINYTGVEEITIKRIIGTKL